MNGLATKGNDPHDSSTSSPYLPQPSDRFEDLIRPRGYSAGADLSPQRNSSSTTTFPDARSPPDWVLLSGLSTRSAASTQGIDSKLGPAVPTMTPFSKESATPKSTPKSTGSWVSAFTIPVAIGDGLLSPADDPSLLPVNDSSPLSPASNISSSLSLLVNVSTLSKSSDNGSDGDKAIDNWLDWLRPQKGGRSHPACTVREFPRTSRHPKADLPVDVAQIQQLINQQQDPDQAVFQGPVRPVSSILGQLLEGECESDFSPSSLCLPDPRNRRRLIVPAVRKC